MWKLKNDNSESVIKAKDQLNSDHRKCSYTLPKTAIVFFMSKATEYLTSNYQVEKQKELFPRFLSRTPIWIMKDENICFLDGGRGAPMAVDTIETLYALGVKNIISVGMCGAFSPLVEQGQIIVPNTAFVEEGTSLHYYEEITHSSPSSNLLNKANLLFNYKNYPIVSCDAIYRQTLKKEALWRESGAVGVDMETSAIFSVSSYLGINSITLLMVSDIHPLNENQEKWKWHMTLNDRYALVENALKLAKEINKN